MENCHHNADTQDRYSSTAERLQTNFNYAGSLTIARAIRRPEVHLSGSITTTTVTRLQRPVRIQANRLDHGCSRGDVTYCALYAGQ